MEEKNYIPTSLTVDNFDSFKYDLDKDTEEMQQVLRSPAKMNDYTPSMPKYDVGKANPGISISNPDYDPNFNIDDNLFNPDAKIREKARYLHDKKLSKDKLSNQGFYDHTYTPYDQTKKYLDKSDGFNPARDNEDYYYQTNYLSKPWYGRTWDNAYKFLGRTVGGALLKFGQAVGLTGSLGWNLTKSMFVDNPDIMAKVSENYITTVLTDMEDTMKDKYLPVYHKLNYDNQGFFSKLGDGTYWSDEFADGAAFMGSMFIPYIGELALAGKVGTAVSLSSKLGELAEAGIEGGTILGKGFGKTAKFIGKASDLTLGTKSFRGVGKYFYNIGSESAFEASESYKTNKKLFLDQGMKDSEATSKASKIAASVFKGNMAVLAFSNAWESKLFNGILRGVNKPMVGIGGDLSVVESAATTKFGKFIADNTWGRRLWGLSKVAGEGFVMEGLWEENAQLAIQRNALGYYTKKQEGTGKETKVKSTGFFDTLLNQTKDSAKGEDLEAGNSIGAGALLGILSPIAINTFGGKFRKEEAARALRVAELTKARDDFFNFDIYIRDADKNIIFDNKDNPVIDQDKVNVKLEAVKSLTSKLNLAGELQALGKSLHLADVLEKTAFAEVVKAHILNGSFNLLKDRLNDMGKSKDAGVLEMFGFSPEQAKAIFSNKTKYEEYAKLADTIKVNYTIASKIPVTLPKGLNKKDSEISVENIINRRFDAYNLSTIIENKYKDIRDDASKSPVHQLAMDRQAALEAKAMNLDNISDEDHNTRIKEIENKIKTQPQAVIDDYNSHVKKANELDRINSQLKESLLKLSDPDKAFDFIKEKTDELYDNDIPEEQSNDINEVVGPDGTSKEYELVRPDGVTIRNTSKDAVTEYNKRLDNIGDKSKYTKKDDKIYLEHNGTEYESYGDLLDALREGDIDIDTFFAIIDNANTILKKEKDDEFADTTDADDTEFTVNGDGNVVTSDVNKTDEESLDQLFGIQIDKLQYLIQNGASLEDGLDIVMKELNDNDKNAILTILKRNNLTATDDFIRFNIKKIYLELNSNEVENDTTGDNTPTDVNDVLNIQTVDGIDVKNTDVLDQPIPETETQIKIKGILEKLNTLAEHSSQATVKDNVFDKNGKLSKEGGYSVFDMYFKRVSNFLGKMINFETGDSVTNIKNATTVGNYIDLVGRLFFTNPNLSYNDVLKEINPSFKKIHTKVSFNTLVSRFNEIKDELKSIHGNNSIFLSKEMLLTYVHSTEIEDIFNGIAGTMDMLVIDNDGDLHLYDFKNKFADNIDKAKEGILTVYTKEGEDTGNSNVSQWTEQLSLYKDLMFHQLGLEIKSINAIVIPTQYTRNRFTGDYTVVQETEDFNPVPSIKKNTTSVSSDSIFIQPLEYQKSIPFDDLINNRIPNDKDKNVPPPPPDEDVDELDDYTEEAYIPSYEDATLAIETPKKTIVSDTFKEDDSPKDLKMAFSSKLGIPGKYIRIKDSYGYWSNIELSKLLDNTEVYSSLRFRMMYDQDANGDFISRSVNDKELTDDMRGHIIQVFVEVEGEEIPRIIPDDYNNPHSGKPLIFTIDKNFFMDKSFEERVIAKAKKDKVDPEIIREYFKQENEDLLSKKEWLKNNPGESILLKNINISYGNFDFNEKTTIKYSSILDMDKVNIQLNSNGKTGVNLELTLPDESKANGITPLIKDIVLPDDSSLFTVISKVFELDRAFETDPSILRKNLAELLQFPSSQYRIKTSEVVDQDTGETLYRLDLYKVDDNMNEWTLVKFDAELTDEERDYYTTFNNEKDGTGQPKKLKDKLLTFEQVLDNTRLKWRQSSKNSILKPIVSIGYDGKTYDLNVNQLVKENMIAYTKPIALDDSGKNFSFYNVTRYFYFNFADNTIITQPNNPILKETPTDSNENIECPF